MVGSGAKILGPVNIGSNVKVASGAVVLDDIPEESTAVGIPARVVRRKGVKTDNLDQVHIPDPVSQELCKLELKIKRLEEELSCLKAEKE
jgi:serine O-acetyltransferase